jgi:hypothetical protein
VDKPFRLFGKNSGVFNKKLILQNGVPLVIFGRESEREHFVILKLEGLFKLIKDDAKKKKRDF